MDDIVPNMIEKFWERQLQEIRETDFKDFKQHDLPLARIKKIMKSDEGVKMISAEVPILFAKACELFVLDLTLRSWLNTDSNKRRTLQRSDVALALSKCEMFDFLIDIVPRDDISSSGTHPPSVSNISAMSLPQSGEVQQVLPNVNVTGQRGPPV